MPHERTHVEAHAGRHDESGDTRNTVDYATAAGARTTARSGKRS